MWGSASADRSLIETLDTVLWLLLHFGGEASPLRPGMSDDGSLHPLRQRPFERRPASAGRAETVPMFWTASAVRSIVSRVPRCLLRQASNPRPGGTDLLRQAPATRVERTDLLRQAPTLHRIPPPASAARGIRTPPRDARFGTHRPRWEGTKRPLPDRRTAHFGGRRGDPWEAPPPASAGGSSAPASADAEGTLEDSGDLGCRPRWLRSSRDLGDARRSRSSGVHSRPSSSEDERPSERRRKPPPRGEGRQRTCSRRSSKTRATGWVRPKGRTETARRQRPQ